MAMSLSLPLAGTQGHVLVMSRYPLSAIDLLYLSSNSLGIQYYFVLTLLGRSRSMKKACDVLLFNVDTPLYWKKVPCVLNRRAKNLDQQILLPVSS